MSWNGTFLLSRTTNIVGDSQFLTGNPLKRGTKEFSPSSWADLKIFADSALGFHILSAGEIILLNGIMLLYGSFAKALPIIVGSDFDLDLG